MKRVAVFLCLASFSVWLPTSAGGQEVEVASHDSVVVNGITLAYRVIGEGEPLVLLHGFGGTGSNWNALLENSSEVMATRRTRVDDLPTASRHLIFSHFWTDSAWKRSAQWGSAQVA